MSDIRNVMNPAKVDASVLAGSCNRRDIGTKGTEPITKRVVTVASDAPKPASAAGYSTADTFATPMKASEPPRRDWEVEFARRKLRRKVASRAAGVAVFGAAVGIPAALGASSIIGAALGIGGAVAAVSTWAFVHMAMGGDMMFRDA